MLSTIERVGIVGKHREARHIAAVRQVIDYCQNRNLEVWVESETAAAIEITERSADFDQLGKCVQLMIVSGGDGLVLMAARHMAAYGVPVLGINRGRLGFLAHIAACQMEEALDSIFADQASFQQRGLIEARVFREGCPIEPSSNALNDVYLSRGGSGRLMEFELIIDGEFVYRQRADGLIVSTPTGSTAYALSANGPIVHPTSQSLLIVPLCPHSLSCRPLVVPDDVTIECRLLEAPDAYLHIDGQIQIPVTRDDVIKINQASCGVCLILPKDYRYFGMLREKLHWSESPVTHQLD